MFQILHYLAEINKEQSFSRAAEKLYLSQSSLSITVKRFEQDIGLQIFDRSTSPIQLTEAGKKYMDLVHRILLIEQEMSSFLDDCNNLEIGKIILGAPHLISNRFLPPLLAKFYKDYPNIVISIEEADTLILKKMVALGEVDLVICGERFDKRQFECIPFFYEHVLLAVSKNDPINKLLKQYQFSVDDIRANRHLEEVKKSVPFHHFRNAVFLSRKEGHDMHTRLLELCNKNGFEPKVNFIADHIVTIYSMVDQQLGIGLVGDMVVKLDSRDKNVVLYKVDELQFTKYFYLAYRKSGYISHAMRKFIDMVRETDKGSLSL